MHGLFSFNSEGDEQDEEACVPIVVYKTFLNVDPKRKRKHFEYALFIAFRVPFFYLFSSEIVKRLFTGVAIHLLVKKSELDPFFKKKKFEKKRKETFFLNLNL